MRGIRVQIRCQIPGDTGHSTRSVRNCNMVSAMLRRRGVILALFLLSGALVPTVLSETAQAAEFVVTSNGDAADADLNVPACDNGSGQCTLRAAIQQANATPALDQITFEIGVSGGLQTIMPGSALPTISNPVIIDGTTQDGYSGMALIEITGTNAGDADGLVLMTDDSTIQGLVINDFDQVGNSGRAGIRVLGNDNIFRSNIVGLDDDGTTAKGNWWGIRIEGGARNVIGGTTPAQRNVISSNIVGVPITGTTTMENVVQGNYIGTDVTGTLDLGNSIGVNVHLGNNNQVGTPGAGNLISGNSVNLELQGPDTTQVKGNLIGTKASGLENLVGNGVGIKVTDGGASTFANDNVIGGSNPLDRNVIAGNSTGIELSGVDTVVRGNYVGVGSDGETILGNEVGIEVLSGSTPASATIGGEQPGQGNVIAHSLGDGISLTEADVGPVTIFRNSFFSNGSLGIDLNNDDVSANDALDADGGPNDLQNFPQVNYVAPRGGVTIIRGVLNSTPSSTFRIELFSSSSAHPSGYGEGRVFLESREVQTDSTGLARFATGLQTQLRPGHFVTATATDANGNTSEFSAAKRVCTILGTGDNETLTGTNKVDVICGLGGKDDLRGKDGDDVLLGGGAADKLLGGDGRDVLEGGPGDDDLDGGPKRDVCRQGEGSGSRTSCELPS